MLKLQKAMKFNRTLLLLKKIKNWKNLIWLRLRSSLSDRDLASDFCSKKAAKGPECSGSPSSLHLQLIATSKASLNTTWRAD